jgi:hypothetical protein
MIVWRHAQRSLALRAIERARFVNSSVVSKVGFT